MSLSLSCGFAVCQACVCGGDITQWKTNCDIIWKRLLPATSPPFIWTDHLNKSLCMHSIHYRTTRPPLHSPHEADCLCFTAHLGQSMKFIAPSRHRVFTLQLKGKDRDSGLKSSLQLATNSRDRGRCSLTLSVYPSNAQTALRTPWDHQFLFCIQLSLLLLLLLPFPRTHTHIRTHGHIHTHTQTSSI